MASKAKALFDDAGSVNVGKSGSHESASANPLIACLECGTKKPYRDGMRYLANGSSIQRWLCRNCGFRFSENKLNQPSEEKS